MIVEFGDGGGSYDGVDVVSDVANSCAKVFEVLVRELGLVDV